jgi:hypothetical protein
MGILLFVMLLTTNALANNVNGDLPQAVKTFYQVYLEVKPSGVPTKKERAQFAPHISAQLQELLQGAEEVERSYAKATRGQVPPLVEGDLFTSLFEGAEAFRVISCQSTAGHGVCMVEFVMTDQRDKSSFRWQDKVYLVKSPQGWVVEDIEFLGDWPFMHKGRLQAILKKVIERGKKTRALD